MPEIDIQRCVQDSIKIFCSTPKSITYRVHENTNLKKSFEANMKFSKSDSTTDPDLAMVPIPTTELKSEVSPRISAEDLLDLLDLSPDSRSKSRSQSIKILVIDIRSCEEYP
ncbi:TBC domain-containing protein kinase-like protein [Caerostris darwini]|uniref:TBC domain-containing protein kinase-like protein n=1 Tax=Caerostris darwini TaxID=1538125 RepID=A0AAV4VUU8_9ARAC|nr:TBC domain-containing protein kinase-like protein [Caerostris darwini]